MVVHIGTMRKLGYYSTWKVLSLLPHRILNLEYQALIPSQTCTSEAQKSGHQYRSNARLGEREREREIYVERGVRARGKNCSNFS